jgi:hypothetical protein
MSIRAMPNVFTSRRFMRKRSVLISPREVRMKSLALMRKSTHLPFGVTRAAWFTSPLPLASLRRLAQYKRPSVLMLHTEQS